MRAVARAIFDNYLFAQPQVANLDRRTVALNYRFHFHLHLQDAAVGTADNETRQVFSMAMIVPLTVSSLAGAAGAEARPSAADAGADPLVSQTMPMATPMANMSK